jgi:hypothetical protein
MKPQKGLKISRTRTTQIVFFAATNVYVALWVKYNPQTVTMAAYVPSVKNSRQTRNRKLRSKIYFANAPIYSKTTIISSRKFEPARSIKLSVGTYLFYDLSRNFHMHEWQTSPQLFIHMYRCYIAPYCERLERIIQCQYPRESIWLARISKSSWALWIGWLYVCGGIRTAVIYGPNAFCGSHCCIYVIYGICADLILYVAIFSFYILILFM